MSGRVVRLLHVDDMEEEFILVRELLASSPDVRFELRWASDVSAAIEAIKQNSFDVCLVDYYLGGETGFDFTRAAKSSGIATPFILMSGQKDPRIHHEALNIGIRLCLDKDDITTPILLKAINEVIGN
jgi:CheY-like chemotaxis protein